VNIASLLSFKAAFSFQHTRREGWSRAVTKALANEWASKGINVNAIAPDT